MKWPVPVSSFTASNGLVITPLGSIEEAVAHGRALRNGLSISHYPNPETGEISLNTYYQIAASGGNVIFSVKSPEGNEIASGSLKVDLDGAVFVNFVRGRHNAPRSEGSFESLAAQEFARAINERSIELKTIPTRDGVFILNPELVETPAIGVDEGVAAAEPEDRGFLASIMTAFQRIMTNSRINETPAAPAGQEVAVEPADEIVFHPRTIGDSAWPTIASPGEPGIDGLSVVVATDERSLRYIVEQCECRMMWERDTVLKAIKEGKIQVAAIYDATRPADPIVGYTVLTAQQGVLVASDIVGRFEASPTPEMIMAVTNWVNTVNRLAPEQTSENGVERHIALNGARFALPDVPDYIPAYDETGRIVPDHVYAPGRAMATSTGLAPPASALSIPVDMRSIPTNLGGISLAADKFEGWEGTLCEMDGSLQEAIASGSYLPVEITIDATNEKGRALLYINPEGEVLSMGSAEGQGPVSPEMTQATDTVCQVTTAMVSMATQFNDDVRPNSVFKDNVRGILSRGDFSMYVPPRAPAIGNTPAQPTLG